MSRSSRFARATLLWLVPVLSLWTSAALGQRNLAVAPAVPSEPRLALVIGNGAYKDAPLRNPPADARLMARTLRSLGFEVIERIDADQRTMKRAIQEFAGRLEKLSGNGVGLAFYAGHGVQSGGRNYLLPTGAQIESESDLRIEAVSANELLEAMEFARTRLNFVILDACRNNPYTRSFRSAARGLARIEAPRGTLIAYATRPGDVAADGAGANSPYTAALARAMATPGLPVTELFIRVRNEVLKATREKQTPWEEGGLTSQFYFAGGGAQLASVSPSSAPSAAADLSAFELAFWDSIKASTNRADFEEYLRQYPEGRFAGLARNRLQPASAASPLKTPQTQIASVAPSIAASRPPAPPGSIAAMSPGTSFKDCDVCPEMVVIPAGRFTMGSPASEPWRDSREGPPHQVTIARPFAAGKYEVTFDEWEACVREGGCSHKPSDNGWGHGKRPVIEVSSQDAKQYTEWLSRKTGNRYRLLSEAEWEYVARAGTNTAFSTGTSINPTQAIYDARYSYAGGVTGVYRSQTQPVGSFAPNTFGLYDVHGNVWEWTEDCWNGNYNGAPSDGSVWTSGDCGQRVLRGGSWYDSPWVLRSAKRDRASPDFRSPYVGLRVARID